ncbi:unnamed protein product, partial [Didymodactylos carnosus]
MSSPTRVTTIRRTVVEQGRRTLPNTAVLDDGGKIMVIATVRGQHEYEKEELSKLNDRFLDYITRVRQLESINKRVQVELDDLRRLWGFDSSRVRQEYEAQIDKIRHSMETAVVTKAQSEIVMNRAE